MAALTEKGWCQPTRDDETTSGEPPSVGLVEALVAAPARGAVARQALPAAARTWTGAVARAATRKILTFYPATSDRMTAFSRQKCHATRAAVKPSLPFLEWLASSSSPCQRGKNGATRPYAIVRTSTGVVSWNHGAGWFFFSNLSVFGRVGALT